MLWQGRSKPRSQPAHAPTAHAPSPICRHCQGPGGGVRQALPQGGQQLGWGGAARAGRSGSHRLACMHGSLEARMLCGLAPFCNSLPCQHARAAGQNDLPPRRLHRALPCGSRTWPPPLPTHSHPQALLNIISNPVNSTVPIAAETLKRLGVYDEKRVLGVTTLDVVSVWGGAGWVCISSGCAELAWMASRAVQLAERRRRGCVLQPRLGCVLPNPQTGDLIPPAIPPLSTQNRCVPRPSTPRRRAWMCPRWTCLLWAATPASPSCPCSPRCVRTLQQQWFSVWVAGGGCACCGRPRCLPRCVNVRVLLVGSGGRQPH